MKRLVLIFGIFLAVFTACQEEQLVPPVDQNPTAQKSAAAKEVLSIASKLQGLEKLGFGSPSLFTSGVGFSATGRESGRKLTTARMMGDTTDNGGGDGDDGDDSDDDEDDDEWDDDWDESDWTTCATETFTENADGSYTWTLDYGVDGCEEHGYFMKGKLIETYKEEGSSFTSSVEYVDFGDKSYLLNGTSTYSGTWEETKTENTSSGDDSVYYDYNYSGSYSYTENMTVFIRDTLDDGTLAEETIALEAQGSEVYDQNGFTTNEGFSKYTLSNGDFYNTTIDSPLFFSFACEYDETTDTYVFIEVSGIETTTWQEGTESGTFSINYGDGACDNIVTITENGESYDVDFGEEWEDEWSDENDGTNG